MRKRTLGFGSLLILALCFVLLGGNIPVYAAASIMNETTIASGTATAQENDVIDQTEELCQVLDEVVVQGLEDEKIIEMQNISASLQSSCGFFHLWSVTSVLQEGNCTTEGIYRVKCDNCGATGTVLTDAPGHNFINGICTNCGESNRIAPQAELNNWKYRLNENNQEIYLTQYIGESLDVVVYGAYKVNGIIYTTILNGGSDRYDCPFSEKDRYLSSIVINEGVKSTNCGYLFFGCKNLNNLDISNLDTSESTDMQRMFGYYNMDSLDVSNLDTSCVTNMTYMFLFCNNLNFLDLSNFNTSNVKYMTGMFSACYSLTGVDISNFDTSNVIDMSDMFSYCNLLASIDVINFDTSNVIDMNNMFSFCYNLTSINLSNFDTSKVINMSRLFCCDDKLTNLDISNFDTSNVTDMSSMFENCLILRTLDLSNFITYNVDNMSRMFFGCFDLNTIYVNRFNWNTTFADTTNMFMFCGTSRVTVK